MTTQPPGDFELEERLRGHFSSRYGEPPPPSALWVSVSTRLHSPISRARTAALSALHIVEGHLRAIERRMRGVTMEPVSAPPARRVGRAGRILATLAPMAAVLVLVAIAAALFLPRLIQPALPAPSGWHDVTPPTREAIVSYAVSPDVPGLILACLGSRAGTLSESPMGPAQVWRTRDGGASWEQLPQPVVTAGCLLAPIRGEPGSFFLSDTYASQPALWVTHDEGSSWARIPVSDQGMGLPADAQVQSVYQLLTQGDYRDGKLYTAGNPGSAAHGHANDQAFSVTADDGRTWTPLEASRDVNVGPGYTVSGIAADYRSNGAWFRLLASDRIPQSSSGAQPSAPDAVLEHSADNGRTWAIVGRLKGAGPAVGLNLQVLATTPSQPGRVCVTLYMLTLSAQTADTSHVPGVSQAGAGHALAQLGPPPPQPVAVGLYGSDDSGATWHGGTIVQYQREYGGPVWHGVGIDAAGNCYLATTAVRFTVDDTTTIWRLAPGSSAAAQPVQQLHGLLLGYFALGRGPAGTSQRLIGLASKAGPLLEVVCQDPTPCVEPTPAAPHLIWTDAP